MRACLFQKRVKFTYNHQYRSTQEVSSLISYLSIYASSGGFYTFEVPVANYSLKFIFQIHDVKKFFSLCRQISFIPRTALRILTHFVRYIFQLTFKKHRWCNFWIHIFVSGIDVSKLFCWFVLNNVPFQLYTSIQLQYQVAFTTWARVFTCAFPHIVHFYWKLKVDSHETINRIIIVCNKSHHKFCFKLNQIPAFKSTW